MDTVCLVVVRMNNFHFVRIDSALTVLELKQSLLADLGADGNDALLVGTDMDQVQAAQVSLFVGKSSPRYASIKESAANEMADTDNGDFVEVVDTVPLSTFSDNDELYMTLSFDGN
ncbi:hypothetical protein AYI70_g12326 [Smittium culicis]|uniref:Uncharacterized protein n=1 Tax=Smittium culicis TaxID=133412 RepID=A0A1R1WY12_9FUNG|nr:hypothetical protein AYI70_g12326 [Smittium culicis]